MPWNVVFLYRHLPFESNVSSRVLSPDIGHRGIFGVEPYSLLYQRRILHNIAFG